MTWRARTHWWLDFGFFGVLLTLAGCASIAPAGSTTPIVRQSAAATASEALQHPEGVRAETFTLVAADLPPTAGDWCESEEGLLVSAGEDIDGTTESLPSTGFVAEGRLTHFVRQTDRAALVLVHCAPEYEAWLELVDFDAVGSVATEPRRLDLDGLDIVETTGLWADTDTAVISARMRGALPIHTHLSGVFEYDIAVDLVTGSYELELTTDLDPAGPNSRLLTRSGDGRFDYRLVSLPGTARYIHCPIEQARALLFVTDTASDAPIFELAWTGKVQPIEAEVTHGDEFRMTVGCESTDDLYLTSEVGDNGTLSNVRRDAGRYRPEADTWVTVSGDPSNSTAAVPELIQVHDEHCGQATLAFVIMDTCIAQDGELITIGGAADQHGRLLGAGRDADDQLLVAFVPAIEPLAEGDAERGALSMRVISDSQGSATETLEYVGLGDAYMDEVMSVSIGPDLFAVSRWGDTSAQIHLYNYDGQIMTTFGDTGLGIGTGTHHGALSSSGEPAGGRQLAFIEPVNPTYLAGQDNGWLLSIVDLDDYDELYRIELPHIAAPQGVDFVGNQVVIWDNVFSPTIVDLANEAYMATSLPAGPATLSRA